MKKFKVRGEFKTRFEKEVEAENLEQAWGIADSMDETEVDTDEEYDWSDFEIDDVCEVKVNDCDK